MSEQIMDKNVGFEPVEGVVSPTCANGQLYTVKSGDTMFFIAKRFNISLQDLINANPQIADPNTIFPGQVICIPVVPPVVSCPNGQTYRVVKGDTMFEIAQRFGVSLDALIRANPQIKDPNLIYPGQEICIPVAPGPVQCPNGTFYTVKSGDTMFDIARRNNISLASLIMANPQIADPNLIFPGQVICIPKPAMEITPLPAPIEMPMPMPMPPVQQPVIMPCPMPMPPAQQPVTMPCPMPTPVAPIEQPISNIPMMPMPTMPFQGQGMYPMPVYIVVPWEECPFRSKKKKHERRDRRQCR